MSEVNGVHEINGIPVGESLWRHTRYEVFVEDENPMQHSLLRGGGKSGSHVRACFFCGGLKLFVKDYCEECYREFILGKAK
jgi:hypothetical protein